MTSSRQGPNEYPLILCDNHTMRFGSIAKVLAECKLKYYRISVVRSARLMQCLRQAMQLGVRQLTQPEKHSVLAHQRMFVPIGDLCTV